MRMTKRFFFFGLLAGLAGCSKFRTYTGPEVTKIYVFKGDRVMHLMSGPDTLRSYDIALGFAPVGDKKIEGDGKTPEGTYLIDRRNPNSSYHLSVGVSYPDANDLAEAIALGKRPGGDIFIHGRGEGWKKLGRRKGDWTAGCIAVTDREIEEIYAMVRTGTPITIYP